MGLPGAGRGGRATLRWSKRDEGLPVHRRRAGSRYIICIQTRLLHRVCIVLQARCRVLPSMDGQPVSHGNGDAPCGSGRGELCDALSIRARATRRSHCPRRFTSSLLLPSPLLPLLPVDGPPAWPKRRERARARALPKARPRARPSMVRAIRCHRTPHARTCRKVRGHRALPPPLVCLRY